MLPRRDAELSCQNGHWSLCSEGPHHCWSLWQLLCPPRIGCCLKIPSFISLSLCIHSKSSIWHHLSKGGNMVSKPRNEQAQEVKGFAVSSCEFVARICPALLCSFSVQQKLMGRWIQGKNDCLELRFVHTQASPYCLLILVKHKHGFSVGSDSWGIVLVHCCSVDESVLHICILCPSCDWSNSPSVTQSTQGLSALKRAT